MAASKFSRLSYKTKRRQELFNDYNFCVNWNGNKNNKKKMRINKHRPIENDSMNLDEIRKMLQSEISGRFR
jgi:hypothetical protein